MSDLSGSSFTIAIPITVVDMVLNMVIDLKHNTTDTASILNTSLLGYVETELPYSSELVLKCTSLTNMYV